MNGDATGPGNAANPPFTATITFTTFRTIAGASRGCRATRQLPGAPGLPGPLVVEDFVCAARSQPMVIAILEAHIVVDQTRTDDDNVGFDGS